MSPPDSQFSDLNIIAGDFCGAHRVVVELDYAKRRLKLHFGGERHVTKESKLYGAGGLKSGSRLAILAGGFYRK